MMRLRFLTMFVLLMTELPMSSAVAADGRVPVPDITAGLGEQCVEPVDVMRRAHMEFLLHQRDATVHGGIRGAKHSLVGCIACHATRRADNSYVPVNAEGEFCADCHRYTAVSMDCFQCHATVPSPDEVLAASTQASGVDRLLNASGEALDSLRKLLDQGRDALRDALNEPQDGQVDGQ